MKAKPFKQATTTAFPEAQTDEVIAEALAKHAALRPPRAPAKAMPVTPTLPKQPKPARARKRAAGRGW